MNIWEKVKQTINEKPLGAIIEKKQLKDLFEDNKPSPSGDKRHTFEKYLQYFRNYGILKHVDDNKDQIVKRVPPGMTSEGMKKAVYRKRYNKKNQMLEV